MTTVAKTKVATQVYRVYIKSTAQAVWDAITSPEWARQYGYRGPTEYDLRPGGAYRALATPEMLQMGAPEVMCDGEVIEADPPHKLVQTWRAHFTPETAAEGFTRLTWEIEEEPSGGLIRLTVTHELEGAPMTAAAVSNALKLHEGGGGWSWILSDLKSLLETGHTL
jgi:uncharacterized protein YndB with AHSA1/START domain